MLRVSHWLKNAFVFAALVYSKELFNLELVQKSILGFFAFCFVSSSIYIINDIRDIEADRQHEKKKNRPLASGAIPIPNALVLLCVMLICVVLISLNLPIEAIIYLATYVAMNIAYSFGLKNIVILDIFIIAAGFMLRMLTGAAVIGVGVSSWLIICTLFISLFLGIMKRRSEIKKMKINTEHARPVLKEYSEELVRTILMTSVIGSIMSYTLYAVSEHTLAYFNSKKMILTVPIVMYGVFRYLYIDEKLQTAEDTVNAILQDKGLIICGLLWVLSTLAIIYF